MAFMKSYSSEKSMFCRVFIKLAAVHTLFASSFSAIWSMVQPSGNVRVTVSERVMSAFIVESIFSIPILGVRVYTPETYSFRPPSPEVASRSLTKSLQNSLLFIRSFFLRILITSLSLIPLETSTSTVLSSVFIASTSLIQPIP